MGNIEKARVLPPPLYSSEVIGAQVGKDGDEFLVFLGLNKTMVEELRAHSLDMSDCEIQEHTSDRERFGEGSYEEWYSKKRSPFALVHKKTGTLAALVWFGSKPLGRKSLKHLSPEEKSQELLQEESTWHTLVYRSYAPFRGKGLMTFFVKFTIEEYRKQYEGCKLWVGVRGENSASIRLAEKLGFVRVEELYDPEKNWVAMTLEL